MKTILVPTDFSEYSKNAAKYALHMADRCNFSLALFHVYHIPAVDPMMPGEFVGDLSDSMKKDSQFRLDELKQELETYLTEKNLKATITTTNHIGFAREEIASYADEIKPVLVVLGSHHRTGFAKFLSGSILNPLIESLNYPVMIVPENRSWRDKPARVLYATDFNDADEPSLSRLLEIFKPFNAHIECLHVDTEGTIHINEFEMSELERKFKEKAADNVIHFNIIKGEDAKESVYDYIKKNDIDLVSTYSRERNFLQRFVEKSFSKQLAAESDIPLIIFK